MKEMEIQKINLDDIKIISEDFTETFIGWSFDKAFEYLNNPFKQYPDLCLKVMLNGRIVGGIFCKLSPYQKGEMVVIEALHILKEYRSKGYGKILLNSVVERAKAKGFEKIGMLAPNGTDFPLSWYKSLGFKETGWVEMEGEVNNLIFE